MQNRGIAATQVVVLLCKLAAVFCFISRITVYRAEKGSLLTSVVSFYDDFKPPLTVTNGSGNSSGQTTTLLLIAGVVYVKTFPQFRMFAFRRTTRLFRGAKIGWGGPGLRRGTSV